LPDGDDRGDQDGQGHAERDSLLLGSIYFSKLAAGLETHHRLSASFHRFLLRDFR
jgi:hypothetical protein